MSVHHLTFPVVHDDPAVVAEISRRRHAGKEMLDSPDIEYEVYVPALERTVPVTLSLADDATTIVARVTTGDDADRLDDEDLREAVRTEAVQRFLDDLPEPGETARQDVTAALSSWDQFVQEVSREREETAEEPVFSVEIDGGEISTAYGNPYEGLTIRAVGFPDAAADQVHPFKATVTISDGASEVDLDRRLSADDAEQPERWLIGQLNMWMAPLVRKHAHELERFHGSDAFYRLNRMSNDIMLG